MPGWRAARRLVPAASPSGCHQMNGLVEQEHATRALVGRLGRCWIEILLVVLEDHGDVHITGPQHPQRLWRLRLGQHEFHRWRLGRQPRRRCRNQRAEGGRERGQPDPALSQPDVRSELCLGRIQPADDLLGPLGQQPASLGQPDAAADALEQLAPGLGLKPGDVMTDRWLGVVQRSRGGGDRSMPSHGDQNPEPCHIQHLVNYRSARRDRREASTGGALIPLRAPCAPPVRFG